MIGAAVLGLVTCVISFGSLVAGELVRIAPTPTPPWIARYEILRPVVEPLPRVGFWGRKVEFFRAQYVLAPVVLEMVDTRRPVPSAVVVDVVDPADRDAALDWLREEAERRGAIAEVHSVGRGFVVVDLRGRQEGS
jgi:hypothetical protein